MEYRAEIGRVLWLKLLWKLRTRGANARESGAFLLGNSGSSKILDFIPYDDLDPRCLDKGYVEFSSQGYVALTDICRKRGLRVIADVHTHPSHWTGQSGSDSTHPMIPRPGHIALIVPCFARQFWRGLKGVGIYEYLGNHRWRSEIDILRIRGL